MLRIWICYEIVNVMDAVRFNNFSLLSKGNKLHFCVIYKQGNRNVMYASPSLFHIVNKAFNINNSKKCLTIFYRKYIAHFTLYNVGVSGSF